MRTAIDTNIVSALWSGEAMAQSAANQLGEAKQHGAVVIAPVVYAELLAHPGATQAFVDNFLASTGIAVDFELEASVWKEAGQRFAGYANLRRKSGQGEPRHLLADFLIGAHALLQADRLMTLDASRYRQHFSELKLV